MNSIKITLDIEKVSYKVVISFGKIITDKKRGAQNERKSFGLSKIAAREEEMVF
ncbi:MAG: hypothetical protein ACTHKA_06315 [Anaerocolumna jejuensis]